MRGGSPAPLPVSRPSDSASREKRVWPIEDGHVTERPDAGVCRKCQRDGRAGAEPWLHPLPLFTSSVPRESGMKHTLPLRILLELEEIL